MVKNIELFKSLFGGRTDIYAVRWEKDGRSGYIPADNESMQKMLLQHHVLLAYPLPTNLHWL